MFVQIHPDDPDERKIQQIVNILENGGVIVYPTDTVYALGCDITKSRAIERICHLRKMDPGKANLTMICKDISQLSSYTMPIETEVFRVLRRNLPGPFTFIFKANNTVPKLMKAKKNTVGIRIPKNNIALALVEALGRPILSISLKSDDEIAEYFTDPQDIFEDVGKLVDAVIDGGIGGHTPSTVVDCTGPSPEVIREGAGLDLL